MLGAWVRTKRGLACPVCKKVGWCLLHMDGKKVICPRVRSLTKIKSGYIHKVYDNGLLNTKKAVRHRSNRRINWRNLVRLYTNPPTDVHLSDLSRKLSLSIETLQKFSVGWDREAWTIPAKNGIQEIIGIQRRFPDGSKLWVPRSDGQGLFIPVMKSAEGNVFVTEGWTDAAVFVELGFRALGRASCDTGVEHLKDFLHGHPLVSRFTLVGDNDPKNIHGNVGQKGINTLARDLYGQKVDIAVLDIPAKYKDARQWYTQGDMDEHKVVYGSRLI